MQKFHVITMSSSSDIV